MDLNKCVRPSLRATAAGVSGALRGRAPGPPKDPPGAGER